MTPRWTSTCPCGKRRYETRGHAKHARRVHHPYGGLGIYRCGDYWHIGNKGTMTNRQHRDAHHRKKDT